MRHVLRRLEILEEDQRFMRLFFTLGNLVRASVPSLVGLACGLAFVGLATAQMPTPNSKLKVNQTGVTTNLREKNFAALDTAQFDAYFNEYFLLLLADADAKPPMDLPTVRQQLRMRYFAQGKSGEPYLRLVKLSFDMMKNIIKQKFPDEPKYDALKMNAMLVIGDLNEQEGEVGAKPKPYAPAMQYMLGVINNPKEPDFLRVPALLGIQRQCTCFDAFPPSAEGRKEIAVSMLKVLKQNKPLEGRDADAQAWLRRLALQNLASLGSPGAEGASDVVEAIVAAVRDEENPMSVRCAAASALSDIKLAGVNGVSANDLGNQLGALALALEKRECEPKEEEEEESLNLRRLKLGLKDVYYGLVGRDTRHGLWLAAPEPRRPAIEEMAKKIKEVLMAPSLSVEDLEKKRLELEKLVKVAKPAAALVAPPADPKGAAPKTGARKSPPAADAGPLAGAAP